MFLPKFNAFLLINHYSQFGIYPLLQDYFEKKNEGRLVLLNTKIQHRAIQTFDTREDRQALNVQTEIVVVLKDYIDILLNKLDMESSPRMIKNPEAIKKKDI